MKNAELADDITRSKNRLAMCQAAVARGCGSQWAVEDELKTLDKLIAALNDPTSAP